MNNTILKWLISITLVSHFSFLGAHTKNEVLTDIIISADKQVILIRHQVPFHDAEHASKQIFGVTKDILNNAIDQMHLVNYVAHQFKISRPEGDELKLDLDDFGIMGEYINIFQRLVTTDLPDEIMIEHAVFNDVWSEQTNLVTVQFNDTTQTKTFTADSKTQALKLSSLSEVTE